MAVMGARPATGPFGLGRGGRIRSRTRPRQRAAAQRQRRSRLNVGLAPRLDVRPIVVVIAVALALAFFYLSQSTGVAARGYEISALEARLAEVRAEQQQLVMAIGEARSPAEIARRGRAELGLRPLDPTAVSYATPDTPAD